jgi:uncharacterized Zn finger protein
MIYTIKAINGLYIIISDGLHEFMKDSTFNELTSLNVGDELELDMEDIENSWWDVND